VSARLMLAPAALAALVLIGLPAVLTVGESLLQDDLVGTPRFVGLDNYVTIVQDPVFRDALRTSLLFCLLVVPVRLLGALAFALLLHRPRRGAAWQRAAVFAPTAMPDVAVVAAWTFLLNPGYGPVNGLLGLAGLPGPSWFAEPWPALIGVSLMAAFTFGEGFLVMLAARQELPGDLFEAARLEGASAWHALRRVTLPLLAPVLGLLAARDVAVVLQASFVPAYLTTDGGPDRATLTLPLHLYDTGFEQFRFGEAAAMTVVLLALGGVLVLLQWRILRHWRAGVGGATR
jgi:multiple sugar transport system permease protein